MAWHSVSQAQKLTGKSRRTLYRDMASGRVSYRMGAKGNREFETSELIRVYGEPEKDGTEEWPTVTQSPGTLSESDLRSEIRALRQEVGELKSMLLRLENKEAMLSQNNSHWWQFWKKRPD